MLDLAATYQRAANEAVEMAPPLVQDKARRGTEVI